MSFTTKEDVQRWRAKEKIDRQEAEQEVVREELDHRGTTTNPRRRVLVGPGKGKSILNVSRILNPLGISPKPNHQLLETEEARREIKNKGLKPTRHRLGFRFSRNLILSYVDFELV
ncbi:hypothetical protein ACFE04_027313 [Oxalis oulophora]